MNRLCVRPLASIVIIAAAAVACGQNGSTPSSPTTSTAAQQTATPVKPSGATVSGTVLGVPTSSGGVSTRAATLTVTVVGTTVTASVDGNGRFELRNVPPGRIELRFQGANVDARLEIGVVVDQQTVVITVRVNGSTATLENGNQGPNPGPGPGPTPNPPNPPPNPPATTQVEVEGTVTATSASGFTVAGRTVVVTAATKIERGDTTVPLSAITVGTRVEVKGTVSGTSTVITATKVEIEQQEADDDDDENEAELKGAISALTGSCATNTRGFTVASTPVTTNAATRFQDTTCAALLAGDVVEVKGARQPNGSVLASRVEKKKK